LSNAQKEELREALQDTQADLSEVLTDEQIAELREILQTRRQNRRR